IPVTVLQERVDDIAHRAENRDEMVAFIPHYAAEAGNVNASVLAAIDRAQCLDGQSFPGAVTGEFTVLIAIDVAVGGHPNGAGFVLRDGIDRVVTQTVFGG